MREKKNRQERKMLCNTDTQGTKLNFSINTYFFSRRKESNEGKGGGESSRDTKWARDGGRKEGRK